MPPNPIQDFIPFVTKPEWTTAVLLALLAGAVVLAIIAWTRDPAQRMARNLGIAVLRVTMGVMWWQQSLWKIPPNFGGLEYWIKLEAQHAAIPLQGELVGTYLVPNLPTFGPVVYAMEVVIAVSLILGVASRWGALLGAAMAANLWLGLYSAPGEWPWTYGYLVVIQLLFAIDPPGRSLGWDALGRSRMAGAPVGVTGYPVPH